MKFSVTHLTSHEKLIICVFFNKKVQRNTIAYLNVGCHKIGNCTRNRKMPFPKIYFKELNQDISAISQEFGKWT